MKILSDVMQVHSQDGAVLAEVVLNGYNIQKGGPLGRHGPMLSFKLVQGNLWDAWNTQDIVQLSVPDGNVAQIRVAAIPAEDDTFGLLEFV